MLQSYRWSDRSRRVQRLSQPVYPMIIRLNDIWLHLDLLDKAQQIVALLEKVTIRIWNMRFSRKLDTVKCVKIGSSVLIVSISDHLICRALMIQVNCFVFSFPSDILMSWILFYYINLYIFFCLQNYYSHF